MDLSQVMLSNIMQQLGNHKNAEIEENMVRHMVLNSIRSALVKYKQQYGKMVIACDNRNYWRKQLFPYYKANRKTNQQSSGYDWQAIFSCLDKIRQELKEHFPYCIIEIETAEADDIIATLCNTFGVMGQHMPHENVEKIMILSADKDFIQLHKYKNVEQYDFIRNKRISHPDPELYLEEHILKGDSGDGIPNILSADNCLVVGQRQTPMTQKKIDQFLSISLDGKLDHPNYRNYIRNKQLVDLTQVPVDIKNKIIASYMEQQNKVSNNLINYFISHKLKNLMESLGDFVQ